MAKRVFDALVAGLLLVMLAPVLLLIGLAVRCDSPGPALFRQVRVGRFEREFQILKFRTMFDTPNDAAQPLITVAGDRRITRLGQALRRFKLDELPQLINVVRGEMSLVGPRPEVPEYVALYPAEVRQLIFSVRPGITDEAAIYFRNEGEMLGESSNPHKAYVETILPVKVGYYLRYVQKHSLGSDLGILVRTFFAVFRRQKPRKP